MRLNAGVMVLRSPMGIGEILSAASAWNISKKGFLLAFTKVFWGLADNMHRAVKETKKTKDSKHAPSKGAQAGKQKGPNMSTRSNPPVASALVEGSTFTSSCANCHEDAKCRRRDFSEQAWSVLLMWNEVQRSAVDQAICEVCYEELRDVLIDRSEEIELVLSKPAQKPAATAEERPAARKGKKVAKLAS